MRAVMKAVNMYFRRQDDPILLTKPNYTGIFVDGEMTVILKEYHGPTKSMQMWHVVQDLLLMYNRKAHVP